MQAAHAGTNRRRWPLVLSAALFSIAVTIAVVASSRVLSWSELRELRAVFGARACTPAWTERLGIPFFRVCPPRYARSRALAAFFISGPLRCAAGSHDSVSCVAATDPFAPPLLPALDTAGFKPAVSALLVDSFTAHRICGLRFGGRLPTLAERTTARDSLGVASFVATNEANDEIEVRELGEWVTEAGCDNPNLPGPECRFATFPPQSIDLASDAERLRVCDVRRVAGRANVVPLNGRHCRLASHTKASTAQSCTLNDIDGHGTAVELRCDASAALRPARSAPNEDPRAAFRCVLADADLARYAQPMP